MLLYYVLITLPCPTIARWTVGFKCCTYCEYKITIMLPSLVQLYTEPSNATTTTGERYPRGSKNLPTISVTVLFVGALASAITDTCRVPNIRLSVVVFHLTPRTFCSVECDV